MIRMISFSPKFNAKSRCKAFGYKSKKVGIMSVGTDASARGLNTVSNNSRLSAEMSVILSNG